MSSTSSTLDRSSLDGKDRNELQTIAQAMGGKPTSRMRKAEIIDLIMDLAGVDGDSTKTQSAPGGQLSLAVSDTESTRSSSESDDDTSDDEAMTDATTDQDESRRSATKSESNEDADDGSDRGESSENGSRQSRSGANRSDTDVDSRRKSTTDDGSDDDNDRSDDKDRGQSKDRGGDQDRSSGKGRGSDSDRGTDKDRGSDRSRNDGRGGRNDRNDRNRDDRNSNDRNRDDRNSNDRNSNDRNRDDADPGNRKSRRRRGRDRDDSQQWDGDPIDVEGYLDLRDEGYGFLRVKGALPSKDDVYVPVKYVRNFGLRRGDYLKGKSRPAQRNEKNPALLELNELNGAAPDSAKKRPKFEDLTPLFPDEKLQLERPGDSENMTTRIIDLISPIGKGQRGLIVSPPKAGKTTIVKEIVRSIEVNNPEVKVLVLLVDERPEEVTDMRRWLIRGEVVASTFDRPSDEHAAVAEMTIERAKRMVERGEDVVIILDGITRLARAYNLAAPATGRIMSGGVDSGALYPPKRFFGAARNVEEGGSLTIVATALIETGSKMDEVIFEEFKGTGNMELRLDRRTAERRIYPAIDVDASSTRHEELLFERRQLNQVWKLRRVLTGMANDEDNGRGNAAGLELLIDRLKTFGTNDEFLTEVARGPM